MNVITAYLETMFSAYPRTPRMLEAKAELQTMMEDAYNALIAEGRSENEAVGKVITEFGNLDEVAPVLGIATDIAPSVPIGTAPVGTAPSAASAPVDPGAGAGAPSAGEPRAARPAPRYPAITLERARQYADAVRGTQWRLTIAVVLFVMSPIPMFLLVGISKIPESGIGEDVAGTIGMLPLLVMVAAGVLLLISRSRELSPFSDIVENRFAEDPAVSAWAAELARSYDSAKSVALQIAVALWILSAAPLFLSAVLFRDAGLGEVGVFGLCLTIFIVAIGLLVFLPATWAASVSDTVSKTSEAEEQEEASSFFSVISAVYWPLLVVIYLAWSFIWDAWDRSWIVWPIGAVLFAVLASGAGAWSAYRKARG